VSVPNFSPGSCGLLVIFGILLLKDICFQSPARVTEPRAQAARSDMAQLQGPQSHVASGGKSPLAGTTPLGFLARLCLPAVPNQCLSSCKHY
jgi:hypothetical protein